MAKIRCAIVGVGYLGKFHAEKYAMLDEAEFVAVCDTDKERCKEIADKHGVEAVFDYKDLVGKVDAVSIVVPTSKHYEIGKMFLENGIHVLLEKPIATTVAEAEDLIRIAAEKKAKLQVGHLERFNPVVKALKGVLEQPLFIESIRIAPYKPRAADVNVILDLMIHDIDIIQYLTGMEIKQINASGAPVLSKKADIVNARVEFVGGCVANITASRISFKAKRLLRIFQPNTYFVGDLQDKTLNIYRKGKGKMFPGIPEINRENISMDGGDAIKEEIEEFLKAINNDTVPLVTGEDGRNALAAATQVTQIVLHNIREAVKYNKELGEYVGE